MRRATSERAPGSARDPGEEGALLALETTGGPEGVVDEDAEWRALAGGALTDEGAAGGPLRDEGAPGGTKMSRTADSPLLGVPEPPDSPGNVPGDPDAPPGPPEPLLPGAPQAPERGDDAEERDEEGDSGRAPS
ncbi:MAG: hypothetical protein M3312_08025 [Actinomycetota bacterium]|nr:hypothetical protein [Actinomycetota bacterium]